MDRLHEISIVQEGLSHPHEDQVDAVQRQRNALIIEHRTNLSRDLSGGEVALYSEQRGQAELAIHRAAHLAGHTYSCSFPGATCRFCLVASLAAVSRFPPISFRH